MGEWLPELQKVKVTVARVCCVYLNTSVSIYLSIYLSLLSITRDHLFSILMFFRITIYKKGLPLCALWLFRQGTWQYHAVSWGGSFSNRQGTHTNLLSVWVPDSRGRITSPTPLTFLLVGSDGSLSQRCTALCAGGYGHTAYGRFFCAFLCGLYCLCRSRLILNTSNDGSLFPPVIPLLCPLPPHHPFFPSSIRALILFKHSVHVQF